MGEIGHQHTYRSTCRTYVKVSFYSLPKTKIKIFLKPVKLKQQDVSSEVLTTAIDVKYNSSYLMNANQGKMQNIVTKLLEGGLETRHFRALFLKNYVYDQGQIFGNG